MRDLATDELERIRAEIGDDEWFEREGRPRQSRELFERVALSGAEEFVEFLTLPAYDALGTDGDGRRGPDGTRTPGSRAAAAATGR